MSSVLFAEEGGLFLYKPKHPEAVLSSFNKAFDKKQKKVFTLARQYGNMVPHKIILEVYFMNKKLITLLSLTLVAVLLIGFAACGGNGGGESSTLPAGESDGSTEPVEVVADYDYIKNEKNNELIIGITLFEPMNYEDENGEYTGFETEFAKAVCEKLGFTPKFQVINWGAKETELKAKNIDCIWNGMTIDAEREANMSISVPYMANKQVLVVKSANKDITSVEGLKVVAEQGSAGQTLVEGNAEDNITADPFFTGAKFTAVDTQAKALTEVTAGNSDACVVDYVCSIGMIGEGTDNADLVVVESQSFNDEQYGIAFRKGSDLTAKVNEAIQALADDGTLAQIADKYKLGEQILVKPAA